MKVQSAGFLDACAPWTLRCKTLAGYCFTWLRLLKHASCSFQTITETIS